MSDCTPEHRLIERVRRNLADVGNVVRAAIREWTSDEWK